MVAIVVLLVGVLGAAMMIDGANAETSQTKARAGGTALARTVLEIARGVPYDELTSQRVLDELEVRKLGGLGDADVATHGHQVESQGFVYTVVPSICSMDDPKDALGTHDIGVVFCSNTDVPAGSGTIDRNPDDYRRMEVQLSWKSGSGPIETVRQTGIVTNPVGGLGPSVTSFLPKKPSSATIGETVPAVENPTYSVQTSKPAADVKWAVNGREVASATGAETS
jgi:hypothetical protein